MSKGPWVSYRAGTWLIDECQIAFCLTPVLGIRLGVDFTFAWDNNDKKKKPHLNFLERNSTRC